MQMTFAKDFALPHVKALCCGDIPAPWVHECGVVTGAGDADVVFVGPHGEMPGSAGDALIVGYGSWKTRKNKDINSFLKGDNEMRWYTIGLSIMATQASAITFLSTPGQAYESGMGFVQFYFVC